ncbi:hypothetical protein K438DRAFT_1812066 [Mycena galopus ATCC 62051]|nr:hypothetical protein K438DRAFT_1812066 [Mycena galopus ATCC 62051]
MGCWCFIFRESSSALAFTFALKSRLGARAFAFHLTRFVSASLVFSNHLLSLPLVLTPLHNPQLRRRRRRHRQDQGRTRCHASACLSDLTISISICFHSVLLPFLDSALFVIILFWSSSFDLASLARLHEPFCSI